MRVRDRFRHSAPSPRGDRFGDEAGVQIRLRNGGAGRAHSPKSERDALELATACEQRSGSRRARRSDRTTSRSPSARVDALSLVASTQQPCGAMATNAQRPYSRCCYRPPGFPNGKAVHGRASGQASSRQPEPRSNPRRLGGSNYLSHWKLRGPTTCQMGTIVSGNRPKASAYRPRSPGHAAQCAQ
jgi:hypothetical protein